MAERRMFSKTIVLSDDFLDMPMSARILYFTFGMVADDDGFVNNPRGIMRQINATNDDLRILVAKKYVILFDSGIIVIRHWRIHNYIQKDRYKPSKCLSEKGQISVDENGVYTECIHDVSTLDTQDRLEIELELSKDKRYYVEQNSTLPPPSPDEEPPEKPKIPYQEIVECLNRNAGTHYKYTTGKTQTLIHARFKEGFTFDDFRTVIEAQCREWSQDKRMERYMRPETLFGTKFEGYLNKARKEAERNGADSGTPKVRYGVHL
nr:MAG TPA: replisome organizer [Caudoviricetes sp.]